MRRTFALIGLLTACGDNLAFDPCAATSCPEPQAPVCDGTVAITTKPATCSDVGGAPQCNYDEVRVDCANSAMVCVNGACQSNPDPCAGVSCDAPPPPSCSGMLLTTFPATGTCDSTGGTAACLYSPSVTDCTATGKVCAHNACVLPSDLCI